MDVCMRAAVVPTCCPPLRLLTDPGPLELCVKTLWGKNLQVCLLPSNTVNELKQTICDQEGALQNMWLACD